MGAFSVKRVAVPSPAFEHIYILAKFTSSGTPIIVINQIFQKW